MKQPLQSIPHLSSGNTASPLRSHSGPQRNPLVNHACLKESSSLVPDLKYYVSQIQQDADKDLQSLPADTVQVYCRECQHSLSGSLHSLDLSSIEEDLNYNYLQEWGPKFVRLKELYELPTEQL